MLPNIEVNYLLKINLGFQVILYVTLNCWLFGFKINIKDPMLPPGGHNVQQIDISFRLFLIYSANILVCNQIIGLKGIFGPDWK